MLTPVTPAGVVAVRGGAEVGGEFCPGGRLPICFGVGVSIGWFLSEPGWTGVADGLGTFTFGGVPFGAIGDPPGTFPLAGCLSADENGVVVFPPDWR